jgi:hypothetical protein
MTTATEPRQDVYTRITSSRRRQRRRKPLVDILDEGDVPCQPLSRPSTLPRTRMATFGVCLWTRQRTV